MSPLASPSRFACHLLLLAVGPICPVPVRAQIPAGTNMQPAARGKGGGSTGGEQQRLQLGRSVVEQSP